MSVKIGIRPVIDGRQFGIRESLEEQTMGMARAAAELITAKVRHADGTPVECVIADTTIGGIAESAACASTALPSISYAAAVWMRLCSATRA